MVRNAWVPAIIFSLIAQLIHDQLSFKGGLLALALGLGYAFGFAINDYFDKELDAIDTYKAKNNYFVNNTLPRKLIVPIFVFLSVIFFLVAFQFGMIGIVILLFLLFILWGYSAEPFKFKRRVGFDIFIHAFFVQTNPYFVTLILLNISLNVFDYWSLGLLFLSSLGGQLAGQIRDYYIDEVTHKTFAIKLGMQNARKVYYFVLILLLLTVMLGIILRIIPSFILPLLFLGIIFTLFRPINTGVKPVYSKYLDQIIVIIAAIYISIFLLVIIYNSKTVEFFLTPI